MKTIEYTIGSEHRSSNWGKFFIQGLEDWKCGESFVKNSKEFYTDYCCNNVPEDTVFTVFDQSGDKYSPKVFQFWILAVGGQTDNIVESSFGSGKVQGDYRTLAYARGQLKACRLMDWWNTKPTHTDRLEYAIKCGEYIQKRGVKDCPSIMLQPAITPKQMLALDTSITKLIDKYGLENVKLILARISK
jgi:hypothetical protein